MLARNPSKSFKNNHQLESDSKNIIDSYDPKVRILQYELVFVTGLPSNIASNQILNGDLYFGRYGKVIKSILNPPYPLKKGVSYQAYATYENQLNASLAVVALDGFNLLDRPLKVSYGTTKYCAYFLKGRQCTNSQCFYIHEFNKQREVINGDTRAVFKQQNDRAIGIVLENLEQVVNRILDNKLQFVQNGFPSLSQMIDFLIDNEFIDERQYEELYQKVRKQKINKLKEKKVQEADRKSSFKQKEDQLFNVEEMPKLIKSNSFSTMATPSKPAYSTQFDWQQKHIEEIDQQSKKQTLKSNVKSNFKLNDFEEDEQLQDRTVRSSDNSTKKIYENSNQFEQRLEQKISHKIIKQILKKKGVKSRFDFVKSQGNKEQQIEEVKKVKNIIQRFLITYQ